MAIQKICMEYQSGYKLGYACLIGVSELMAEIHNRRKKWSKILSRVGSTIGGQHIILPPWL